MLYVSTRSKTDSYTAYRALHEDRAPDGGMFVPMRFPSFQEQDIASIKEKTFGENVAGILNFFFSAGITGWDIDFLIGRQLLRLQNMNHRLILAELWHNSEFDYRCAERSIYNKLCNSTGREPTEWAAIAIRISVLFGIYGNLDLCTSEYVDIAVTSGDFLLPVAAWYARSMGLPIGTIVCGSNENSALWDFLHHGGISTGTPIIKTDLPLLDIAVPTEMERLIYAAFGYAENERFLQACNSKSVYQINDEQRAFLAEAISVGIVSNRRARSTVLSFFRTNRYLIDGYTAVSYGSLQDYRANSGESRLTVLLIDRNPIYANEYISECLGVSAEEVKELL